MTPLDHAQQRRHTDCIKILQTYGLKRPPSALSVASQVSLTPTTAPLVDEHGHVPLRRPKRQFSLSGISVSSINRLPADGQAHSESPPEEQSLASGGIEGQEDCAISMYNTLKGFYLPLQMLHLLVRVQLRSTCPSHHSLENSTRYVQECVTCSYVYTYFQQIRLPSSLLPSFLPLISPFLPFLPLPSLPPTSLPPLRPPPPPSLHTGAKDQTEAMAPSPLWLIRRDHLLLRKEQCCRAHRLHIMKQQHTRMALYVFQI